MNQKWIFFGSNTELAFWVNYSNKRRIIGAALINVSALKCGAYSRAAVNRVNTVTAFYLSSSCSQEKARWLWGGVSTAPNAESKSRPSTTALSGSTRWADSQTQTVLYFWAVEMVTGWILPFRDILRTLTLSTALCHRRRKQNVYVCAFTASVALLS